MIYGRIEHLASAIFSLYDGGWFRMGPFRRASGGYRRAAGVRVLRAASIPRPASVGLASGLNTGAAGWEAAKLAAGTLGRALASGFMHQWLPARAHVPPHSPKRDLTRLEASLNSAPARQGRLAGTTANFLRWVTV